MTSHPYDILQLDNGAQLIFTPCPGTKTQDIKDSIATLLQANASALLTLMSDEEMARNNASSLPQECSLQDVAWMQLPIPDDAAPEAEFETKWEQHKESILAVINNKGTVAVHCKGGSGRTGLVIGLILLAYGWPAEKVIKEVQALRPKALKYPAQLNYFNTYL